MPAVERRRNPAPGQGDRVRPGPTAARLALVLVALLGLVLAAGWLLTRSSEGDAFERRDAALVRWFAAHRTAFLDSLSGPAAELGNTRVVVAVGVVVAIGIGIARRSWWPALVLAVALCGEVAVFLTTTALIDRPRPDVPHLDAHLPPTSSFPSGHTAAAICLYGAVAALLLAGGREQWRRLAASLAVLVVLVVAAARLYRGAHYPTDVLGSVLFALPWLLVTLGVVHLEDRSPAHGP